MKGRCGLLIGGVLILLLACAILLLTGINCPIRWLTGVPCPGCGMTRASMSLLVGDRFSELAAKGASPFGTGLLGHLRAAWYFHPLVFVVPPALLYIVLGKKPLLDSKRRENIFILAICTLMIVVYAVRLALHDPVLQTDWNAGAIARILRVLLPS